MADYIEHHGVLGQKWGVRRYQNKDGSLTSAGRKKLGIKEKRFKAGKKKQMSSEQTKKGEKKKKSIEDFTDEELRAAIARLDMEKRYKDLVAPPKPQISRGKKFMNDLLDSSIKGLSGAAGDLTKDIGKYVIGSAVNKAMGENVINLKEKKKKGNDD